MLLALTACDDSRWPSTNKMNADMAERNAKVKAAVWRALEEGIGAEVQAWHEFKTNWPPDWQALGFAWHENQHVFKGTADATRLIQDRYVLKIIVDFEAASDYQEVRFPRVRFHLYEVRSVRPPADGGQEGGFTISFNPTNVWFGPEEWRRLMDAHWDFSTLGVNITTNAPVPNIRKVLPNL
jgi:hypothetical protein